MKLIALLGAGALAAGTMVAAVPADAQRYGYEHDDGGYRQRDYGREEYRRHDHGYGHERRDYRGGYGYSNGYRGHAYGYGRSRVVCRIHRGWHGPERRCFRINR